MGMFDSLYVPCPSCGATVELQSKEGECDLDSYTVETCPANVLIDVLNNPQYCAKCDTWMALVDPDYPPGAPPKPNPRAVILRQPLEYEIHIHDSQPQYRWWQAAFSYADIASGTEAREGGDGVAGSVHDGPAPQGGAHPPAPTSEESSQ